MFTAIYIFISELSSYAFSFLFMDTNNAKNMQAVTFQVKKGTNAMARDIGNPS
jgi:hypothetical protein